MQTVLGLYKCLSARTLLRCSDSPRTVRGLSSDLTSSLAGLSAKKVQAKSEQSPRTVLGLSECPSRVHSDWGGECKDL